MRHRALGLLLTAVLAASLTACASDIDEGAGSGANATPSGPWEFTDASGEVIKLDQTPTRIIAHAGEAAALMTYGIRPVGIYADESIETEPNLQGLDLTGIEILGQEWGKIDVAKAATLDPDLIVADWWPVEKAHSGMEEGVEESSKKLAELAPIVGAPQGESILDLTEGYEKLAASLGADVDDPKLAADKKRFEAARDAFQEAAAAKPGLTVLAVSPTDEFLYVANPKYAPELLDFQAWGLKVIDPSSPDPGFPYWENLSWENADKYQPDMLILDSRNIDAGLATAGKQPTWKKIKAADAGQIEGWPAFWLRTYGDYADALEKLTPAIEKANENVGD